MRTKEKDRKKKNGFLMIAIGLLLIAAALFIAAFNLCDDLRAAKTSGQAVNDIEEYLDTKSPETASNGHTAIPDYVLAPGMEMPVETIDGIDFIGVLRIPALELELPVISQWSYPNLRTAPCRYSGSAYLNNLIICGHNYTSHFGNLKNLKEGDLAAFTDMDGNVFTYKMVERETLLPTFTEAMESGDWDLTLFTCTVGGQSRVTIRFEREDE